MAIDPKVLDELLADYEKPEDMIGGNGLLKQLTKAQLERALQTVLTGPTEADTNLVIAALLHVMTPSRTPAPPKTTW